MILVPLVALQLSEPRPLDLDPRPPVRQELQAAERRSRAQLPAIVRLCRDAERSGDLDGHVRAFADEHGLSGHGRIALAMNCRLYRQGREDSAR